MKPFSVKSTVCALIFLSIFSFSSWSQTPIANYPLTANSNDATGNFGPLVYGTTATQPPTGACSNGTSNSVINTPLLTPTFNSTNFAVSMTFTVNSYGVSNVQPRPVFTIDNLYRGFGVAVGSTGNIGVLYNNSNYIYSNSVITLGQSYTLVARYVSPTVELILNNVLIISSNIGSLTFSPNNANRALYTSNGATGQIANGCISNLRVFSSNVLLPVNLLSFSAVYEKGDKSVHLNWSTAQEINSKKFIIERSANGIDFTLIESVAAAGNNANLKQYGTTDSHPLGGISYYRLRQVDLDGKETLSRTIKIATDGKGEYIVTPNSAKSVTYLYSTSTTAEKVTIQVVDNLGRVLGTATKVVSASAPAPIDVASYRAGNYFIRIISSNKTTTERIVVQ